MTGSTADRARKALAALAIAGAAVVLSTTSAAADNHAGSAGNATSAAQFAPQSFAGSPDGVNGVDDHHANSASL
ncbi:hypothetical protein [Streptomyces sp. I05A-00742]|uniref:hypothetical protein n=1 Tax=Streptomyces sp. I05A-00742 TaxID=2732853 RepID=UPI001488EA90|nr:hypothetical protein [Streptomyces sp. I05A-00742]